MTTIDNHGSQTYNDFIREHIEDCKKTGALTEETLQRMFSNPKKYGTLLQLCMGLQTELGEVIDLLRKHTFYGTELNKASLLEELGDFLFYWDLMLDFFQEEFADSRFNGVTLRQLNEKKRAIRFPHGYSNEAALHRDKAAERQVFEDE